MPADLTPALVTVAAVSVFLYGFSKTGVPGVGMLAGPLLAATLGATTASGFVMP